VDTIRKDLKMEIYNRQETLKLNQNQSVAVVGCGGIGFWVSKYLILSGIREMYVFDPDVFEEHNLNRIDITSKMIGHNKAEVVKLMSNNLRPEIRCIAFPFPFSETFNLNIDWLIDCTDKQAAQLKNQEIAKKRNVRYFKAGYDGEKFSIHNAVAEWGDAVDGYTVVPSWVVPASIIAAMAVAKVMKYEKAEMVGDVQGIFKCKREAK
jgi:molybdopterin/thiamine biosynthesis adenylyltransferase